MFLDTLRKSDAWESMSTCTHANDSFHVQFKEDGDSLLTCRECHLSLSLRLYFQQHLTPEQSISQAQEYVDWTGDYSLPCCLRTILLRKRAPTSFANTSYETVYKGSILLKMLHSPFSRADDLEVPTPEGKQFLRETIDMALDHLIQQFPDDSLEGVDAVVRSAFVFLKNLFDVECGRYFEVLAPYAKSVLGRCPRRHLVLYTPYTPDKTFDLGRVIEEQLVDSFRLHSRSFGLCASFDAVHVAALCFLCREDVNLACDLVLDFVGKICRGHYDGEQAFQPAHDPLESEIRTFLANNVSPRLNVRMNQHLEVLRAGGSELEESLSSDFFDTYAELKSAILARQGDDGPPAHFEWVFPRMLFTNYMDYCAFSAALTHYTVETKMNPESIGDIGRASRSVISECKNIFLLVGFILYKVKALDQCFVESELQKRECYGSNAFRTEDVEITGVYYWTRDMLKRFFELDPTFERDVMNAMKWWTKLPLLRADDPTLTREPTEVKFSKNKQPWSDAMKQPLKDIFKTEMNQSDLFHNLLNCFIKRKIFETDDLL